MIFIAHKIPVISVIIFAFAAAGCGSLPVVGPAESARPTAASADESDYTVYFSIMELDTCYPEGTTVSPGHKSVGSLSPVVSTGTLYEPDRHSPASPPVPACLKDLCRGMEITPDSPTLYWVVQVLYALAASLTAQP